MNAKPKWMRALMVLAVGATGLAFAVRVDAQVETTKHERVGATSREVTVERAEVLSVSGNDLMVKMEDGSIRHIANVSESARVTVNGRDVGVHDLKPGMHLSKTVTTTSTPKVIVTTQTVTGKVWHVNPPLSVTLTMENYENQTFKIPNGQKFMVDGKLVDAWGLKKGMKVNATKVVEEPVTQYDHEVKLAGHAPPPPPAPTADAPILIAVATPAPAPAAAAAPEAAAAAPAELPKTGSNVPLIGLLGLLLMAGFVGLRLFRSRA